MVSMHENFIEEDCQYLGTILLEPPPGTVLDELECQKMCMSIKTSDVNIWFIIGQRNLVHCTKVMQESVQQKEDHIFHLLVCVFDRFETI